MRKMSRSRKIMVGCCFLLFCFLIQGIEAGYGQEKYPSRTVKFVVPMAAGGSTDAICRKLADFVGKSLGQEMIVDNRPGAGGALGASFIAKSKPDGYTVGGVASSTFIILPFFSKMDFDPLGDLVPMVQVFTVYNWLAVTPESPIKSFKDFIEEGRKRQLTVATTGMVIGDIAVRRLAVLASFQNLKTVPFGGSAPGVAAVLGGQVDAIVESGLHEYVRAGKLKYIARLTEGPVKDYKDVPVVSKDFGYDVNAPGFVGMFGPRGLPKDIQARLGEEFTRALRDPSIVEFIDNTGQVTTYKNSVDFGNFLKESNEKAGRMIKELGLGMYAKEKK
jgi:tripartite-type tricarboxylate transporter receptor subunit TctC